MLFKNKISQTEHVLSPSAFVVEVKLVMVKVTDYWFETELSTTVCCLTICVPLLFLPLCSSCDLVAQVPSLSEPGICTHKSKTPHLPPMLSGFYLPALLDCC